MRRGEVFRHGVVLQANAASFRPDVEIAGERTRVLVEQLGAIDPTRLGASRGLLTRDEMQDVDRALSVVLGLII